MRFCRRAEGWEIFQPMASKKIAGVLLAAAVLAAVVLAVVLAVRTTGRHFALAHEARRQAAMPARFTNSLGMVFARLPKTEISFCVWKTRVQDFAVYAKAVQLSTDNWRIYSYGTNGWVVSGDSWENPGFAQTPACPVCGVTWDEANAFCDWLTKTEHDSGELSPQLYYRLPADDEWSAAVTSLKFPWGSQWPPLDNTANLAGVENSNDLAAFHFTLISNYQDGFPRTSPVGVYPANPRGLFDMAGNLQEWCADWYRKELNPPDRRAKHAILNQDGGGQRYRVLRGSAWSDRDPGRIASNARYFSPPNFRQATVGFRVVLALETNLPAVKN
jgi:eukaryotic-like serine/threonine-protein kinase